MLEILTRDHRLSLKNSFIFISFPIVLLSFVAFRESQAVVTLIGIEHTELINRLIPLLVILLGAVCSAVLSCTFGWWVTKNNFPLPSRARIVLVLILLYGLLLFGWSTAIDGYGSAIFSFLSYLGFSYALLVTTTGVLINIRLTVPKN